MEKSKHLLVIRLSAMGDVAMTVPVLVALLRQYPDLRITVLTRGFFKPLFSQIPNLNIYEAEVKGKHSGVFGLFRLYRELKQLEIEAVADLHNVLRSNILKMFFKLSGYPFLQIEKGRREKKALTAYENKVFKPLKSTHERYAEVFKVLGYPLELSETSILPKRMPGPKAKQLLSLEHKKYIGIAPFAAFEGKMYPLDLMGEVVTVLSASETTQIIFFGGGKREQEILEEWESKYSNSISIIGKLTFDEELELISNLDIMLAMDSGNAHLAALFGVPTVTLWGVTHPHAGFYPFHQPIENALLADREKYPLIPTSVYGNKMPENYKDAMRTIAPKEVIAKICSLIDLE